MFKYLMPFILMALLSGCESTTLDSASVTANQTIRFSIKNQCDVTLYIENNYNTRVKTFYDHEALQAGYYSVAWDCLDSKGKPVPMGAYFVTLIAVDGEEKYSKTMILIVGKTS